MGWRSFWRVRGARKDGGEMAEGGQHSSGGGGALLSSAACSARARKGNGEAKSDLAIAMAVESLSGAGSRRHGDAWHRQLCTPSPWQKQGRHCDRSNVFESIFDCLKFKIS